MDPRPMIVLSTLGLSWGLGNQGMGGFHPVPWYKSILVRINVDSAQSLGTNQFVPKRVPRDWVECTQSLIPETPTQSERGTIDVVTGRHEWTRLRLFG